MYEPQKINVKLTIEVPPEYVVITAVGYEELKEAAQLGRWWTMTDLEERTNMKAQWIKEKILYVPKFKVQLEKFVRYPHSQGDKWLFQANKMAKFLEDNFYQIFHNK